MNVQFVPYEQNDTFIAWPSAPEHYVRMIQFGRNLRVRARELGLTDAEVARRAGLTERRYGFYVTGQRQPDLAALIRIASVLQSSVDDLLAANEPHRSSGIDWEARLASAAKQLDDQHLQLLVRTAEGFAQHLREKGGA